MFTISAPLVADQCAMYFREEYARTSYFTEGARLKGWWGGKLAGELNLKGEIKQQQWDPLLTGRDLDGKILVPEHTVAGEAKHRAAWDAHQSPCKSVSIAGLVYGDERLIAAHEETVQECMADLERYAQVRQHGGSERPHQAIWFMECLRTTMRGQRRARRCPIRNFTRTPQQ